MQNEIVINAEGGETRVALLERSVFTELHIEREGDKNVAGNVVKGRVMRVLPGMQAAFVDIGLEKAAFLYVGDYFDNTGTSSTGDGKSKGGAKGAKNGKGAPKEPRRGGRFRRAAPPPIETVLREGQEIVVQIAKEPIGTKGARITSNISIPGRHLVLTPWSKRVGVSRRIGSDKERRRLRDIVDKLKPKDIGFIIRTAGDGVREADLEADIRYLTTVWTRIRQRNAEKPAPAVLHEEHDISLRIIRDLANHETKRIVIDGDEAYDQIKDFAEEFMAEPRPEIERYEGFEPIFDHFDLESQIHANLERKVWLKSGGSLVIDQSEALTAIDVNTGRFVGKSDLEETVFKNNLEAVREVVNQLRFRNIGGLIIIDLIDMEKAEHRDKVYRALQDAIRSDKARTNILKISELGLVEMTRKRTRESLVQTLCEPCAHCEGRGYILSAETVGYKVVREIRTDLPRFCGRQVGIAVSPRLADQMRGPLASAVRALSEELGREIEIISRPGMHQEQFEITALDEGPSVEIALDWLRDPKEVAEAEEAKKTEARERKNGRRSRKRGGRDAEADEEDAASNEEGGGEKKKKKAARKRRGRKKPDAAEAAAEDEAGDEAKAPQAAEPSDAEAREDDAQVEAAEDRAEASAEASAEVEAPIDADEGDTKAADEATEAAEEPQPEPAAEEAPSPEPLPEPVADEPPLVVASGDGSQPAPDAGEEAQEPEPERKTGGTGFAASPGAEEPLPMTSAVPEPLDAKAESPIIRRSEKPED